MKIDTNLIPNFDALPEDAKNAISAMEFADAPDMSQFVSKATFDKKASEAADLNKKLRERMTEEERSKQEREEATAAMVAELEALKHEKAVAKYTAEFAKMGYDAKLAEETAEAYAKGDSVKVFANQQKFLESYKKTIIADELKKTPRPQGGFGGGEVTKEKFLAMGTKEQQEFIQNNPDWQKTLK